MFEVDRARAAWAAVGAVLAAIVLFVLYSFAGTFVFALFIYYATRPVYRRLAGRVRPPSLAAGVSLATLALPVVLLVSYALAIGIQELSRVSKTADLGPVEEATAPYLNVSSAVQDPGALLSDPNALETIRGGTGTVLSSLGVVGTGLLHLFVMFALAFYLLRDGPKLARWFTARFGDESGVFDAYVHAVDTDLSQVFSGNVLNALVTAAIAVIVYSGLNFTSPPGIRIPYPALVGLLAGAASLVPVVGMKLVYVPVTLYLLGTSYFGPDPAYWFPVTFAALSFVVVDTIPDLVLRPYVSGRNLHVGTVMFAYIFGPLIFGWYGIFLGPVLLVLVVHFGKLVLPELIDGTEIRPFTVDPATVPEIAAPPEDAEAADD